VCEDYFCVRVGEEEFGGEEGAGGVGDGVVAPEGVVEEGGCGGD
jgi:hypothetical protein